jgi:hypothetical protein
VHLRRALILFGVVLALAALAASISEPRHNSQRQGSPSATAAPPPHSAPAQPPTVHFDASAPKQSKRLRVGSHVTVAVAVPEAGQVDLQGLGLSDSAEPDTPATFDVLADHPVRVTVVFTPAGATSGDTVGTLTISARGSARSGGRSSKTTAPDRGRTAALGSAAGRCSCSS